MAEIGVVFLLFTLGLEFSFPRMVAMRREVFGLGARRRSSSAAPAPSRRTLSGVGWPSAAVLGGALAMCSTAIVLQQLGDQDELNRTHGRLAFAVLLFQDLAFVPLLALASVLARRQARASRAAAVWRAGGAGGYSRWRRCWPSAAGCCGRCCTRSPTAACAKLFTLAALLVVLTAAWITQRLGLSMALGAFLAGMMLAETEYRHQIEAVIRPFRELLLGLFFISVGMLLDLRLLYRASSR